MKPKIKLDADDWCILLSILLVIIQSPSMAWLRRLRCLDYLSLRTQILVIL